MLNTERLCIGCMNDNGGEKLCPICGYDGSAQNPADTLPARFLIKDRYFIGRVLKKTGEAVVYIGWDTATDTVINIKEYFPLGCAHRNPDKTVSIVGGKEYAFNEGLLEFAEINKSIMGAELPSVAPVTDTFEENGTVYAITVNIPGITLADFLEKNGGTLKWEQARALFLPVIDTVKRMNDLGVIHRGISDETVIVGRDGKLYITDYSIKKLRMTNEDIECQLYSGFSAVEQYGFTDMTDGNYTDVYGLCATLFRVLIGIVPPEAVSRLQNDSMTIPSHFAEELPRHVLAALANGLQVLPQNRTKDVEVFKNELVYGEINDQNTSAANAGNKAKGNAKPQKNKGGSAKYAVISSLCTALVFIIIAAILVSTVFKDEIFKNNDKGNTDNQVSVDAPVVSNIGDVEPGAEVTDKLYSVPNFKGKYYSEILENEAYEMFEFVITDKSFSNDYPKGTVCTQSVAAGSEVKRDTEIEVVISLGPSEIKIANLRGLTEDEAKLELLKQGFLYENIEVLEKYDEDKAPGIVLSQEPEYGNSVSTDVAVKIYINSYEGEETDEYPYGGIFY
ncbi:MAG: PASTA domain-containing protein [Clostridia bacterium]|nr:PASTA domain-containing protein [Clostridia bacterium]